MAKNIGQLGDVKLSLLKESDFREIHGDGWKLMDGSEITTVPSGSTGKVAVDTEFVKLTGLTKNLPDARGMFLRGMQSSRTEGGDTYEQEKGEKRLVGSEQDDSVGPHFHRVEKRNTHAAGPVPVLTTIGEPHSKGTARTYENDGTRETRPRNISVYIYVKVTPGLDS